MLATNPYQAYQENSINTARPEELTLMLYNGAIRFIKQAKYAIENKNIELANESLIKAQNIILELQSTLDMNYDIAKNLDALYDYLYNRLIEGNLKKDQAILDEVLSFVTELRDTWQQAMKLAR